ATPFARRYTTMLVEPAILLDTLTRDFLLRGGTIDVRDFRALPEVLALQEPLVVNCTGLGAAALFHDAALGPIKGQLAVLVPEPEVDYIAQLGSWYTFPRTDGLVLGGSYERGVWSLDNDPETIGRIVEGNRGIFTGMR
ncbi:MAG TPA: FAD-dependent oxidoreductase, partial [Longimicrobiaceae bacterium]|nr:FAD-dependent oxidoreductase [Longimicrobiaceae bacterium]